MERSLSASHRATLGLGLVHVPQDRSLFPHMTVWDNLLRGGYSIRDHGAIRRRIRRPPPCSPLSGSARTRRPGSLSGGEQNKSRSPARYRSTRG